jgi:hypothetical protein
MKEVREKYLNTAGLKLKLLERKSYATETEK